MVDHILWLAINLMSEHKLVPTWRVTIRSTDGIWLLSFFSLKLFSDFDGKDLDWTPFASSPIFKIIFLDFIIDLIELIMIVIFFTRIVMHLKFAYLTDILKYSTSNSWHICSGFKGISLAKHTSCYR